MRFLSLAGVAGPAVFVCAVIISAAFQPHYSHLSSFISELGASGSPRPSLMNYAGFFAGGALFTAFGVALLLGLPRRPLVMVGSALVTVFGVGLIASGALSCDVGCPHEGGSPENQIHNRIGPAAFISLILATGILGVMFRRLPEWRRFASYSLLTTACAVLLFVALVWSLDTRSLTGLWQRLLLATLYAWCAVVGTALYRRHTSLTAPSQGELKPTVTRSSLV